jgi:hypothetical protein
MTAQYAWQKSTYSSTGDECVEVAHAPDGLAIRESDVPRLVLTAERRRLAALVGGAKAGRFDRLTR